VVGHLDDSKGCTFWIPKSKKLVSSAWEDFGQDCLPTAVPQAKANTLELGAFAEEEAVVKQEENVDRANQAIHNGKATTPSTFKQAMRSPEAPGWKKAIHKELENLQCKLVWRVLKIPAAWKSLGARWVFTKKENAHGSVQYKACYIAKGFNQKD
jgi:hypothetical protein